MPQYIFSKSCYNKPLRQAEAIKNIEFYAPTKENITKGLNSYPMILSMGGTVDNDRKRANTIPPDPAVVDRASDSKSTAGDKAVPEKSPVACRSDYSNYCVWRNIRDPQTKPDYGRERPYKTKKLPSIIAFLAVQMSNVFFSFYDINIFSPAHFL